MTSLAWKVGQAVEVQSRTWAGINKPGGCAKIIKIHYNGKNIESLDVKYILGGGCEKEIDPSIVSTYETLERGRRSRRGRTFLMESAGNVVKKVTKAIKKGGTKKQQQQPKQQSKKHKTNPSTGAKKTTKRRRTTQENKPPAESSQQATSPSTPVTPENKPSKKIVKPVAEVPSIIIAGKAVEVSPLDKSCSRNAKTSSTVVRRGLFGTIDSATKKEKRKPSKTKTEQRSEKPASRSSKKQTSFEVSKPKQKVSSVKNLSVKKKPSDSLFFTQPSKSGASLNIARRKPSEDQKSPSKPILELPRPKPTSRGAGKSDSRKTLKNVYDNECRKAKSFVSEVLGNQNSELATSLEKTGASAAANGAKSATTPPTGRFEEFLSVFQSIRIKIDDDAIDENTFRRLINQKASKSFPDHEIDSHVQTLCDDGKFMKAEGTIYIIE